MWVMASFTANGYCPGDAGVPSATAAAGVAPSTAAVSTAAMTATGRVRVTRVGTVGLRVGGEWGGDVAVDSRQPDRRPEPPSSIRPPQTSAHDQNRRIRVIPVTVQESYLPGQGFSHSPCTAAVPLKIRRHSTAWNLIWPEPERSRHQLHGR